MGMLELKNIKLKISAKKLLDDVSIDFWGGHIHAIIGPNGAGKSTMANVIMGLQGYRHFEGDILLDGVSLRDVPVDERARRGITLAWQEPARFEGLKVSTFIGCGARDKSPARVEEALHSVGLNPADYLSRSVDKTLSGGERKRIELASILLMEPRLVLMDEPDSGIDVEALDKIFETLKALKNKGTTIILITHSLAVLKQAEHAFLLCHGKIVDKGSIEKIGRYFDEKCLGCRLEDLPVAEVAP
ncbi:MAG: ABC transporter ATP-binding protein [Lentisphaerota bacterium]